MTHKPPEPIIADTHQGGLRQGNFLIGAQCVIDADPAGVSHIVQLEGGQSVSP